MASSAFSFSTAVCSHGVEAAADSASLFLHLFFRLHSQQNQNFGGEGKIENFAVKAEFDFERDLEGDDAPLLIPGAGFHEAWEKEERRCPQGLYKSDTMVVLRPNMSEDERRILCTRRSNGICDKNGPAQANHKFQRKFY